jgi:anti-anti-sigma factor
MSDSAAANQGRRPPKGTRVTATTEATVVFPDRVARITCVRTTAVDDWRAAVQLCGELDVANADELRRELDSHLDAGRRVIRVDASQVEFIDSTAVGALVLANARCRELHGSLILTGVPRALRRLLRISGLDQVLLVDTATIE